MAQIDAGCQSGAFGSSIAIVGCWSGRLPLDAWQDVEPCSRSRAHFSLPACSSSKAAAPTTLAAHMKAVESLLPRGSRRVRADVYPDSRQDEIASPLSRSVLTTVALRAARLPGALDRGHFQLVTQIMISFKGDRLCAGRYDIKLYYADAHRHHAFILGYCTPPCRRGQLHSGCLIPSDIGFNSAASN